MSKCARCGKIVYPTEELKCLDKLWHKTCFKCDECGMALSMKNYKGYNKIPYCSVHYPQVKATTVTETPESRRLAENTRLQSQVKYHEDFEKSKGKFTQVSDDPETMRVMSTHKIISNASYHGDLEKKKEMEQRRVYLPNENPTGNSNGNNSPSNGSSHSAPKAGQQYHSSQPQNNPNRHQVFVQPQQQNQVVYNMHNQQQLPHIMSQANRAQQHQSQQQFASSIKILSQGNKPVDTKQQQQAFQQQQNQRQVQSQPTNGTKQQQSMNQQQSGDHYSVQTSKVTNSGQHRPQPQQQQYPQPHSSDYNQNNHSSPVRSAPQPVVQQQPQPMQPQSQQPQRFPVSQQNNQQQPQQQATNSGTYSVIYDGSGQKQVIDNSRKVGSILDYDPTNHSYGSSNSGYPIRGPQQQQTLHYQPQQTLPNYGAAVQQQHYHQQMLQQQQHQQYLLQQQHHQQMPYMNQGAVAQQHGSPLRISSAGVIPASVVPQAVIASPSISNLRVRAIYDYTASDVDEVSFVDGDLIVECVPIDEGWMTGTVHRTGQRGMLPANYVEPVQ